MAKNATTLSSDSLLAAIAKLRSDAKSAWTKATGTNDAGALADAALAVAGVTGDGEKLLQGEYLRRKCDELDAAYRREMAALAASTHDYIDAGNLVESTRGEWEKLEIEVTPAATLVNAYAEHIKACHRVRDIAAMREPHRTRRDELLAELHQHQAELARLERQSGMTLAEVLPTVTSGGRAIVEAA
jgi:chromosome segregation ATPase